MFVGLERLIVVWPMYDIVRETAILRRGACQRPECKIVAHRFCGYATRSPSSRSCELSILEIMFARQFMFDGLRLIHFKFASLRAEPSRPCNLHTDR